MEIGVICFSKYTTTTTMDILGVLDCTTHIFPSGWFKVFEGKDFERMCLRRNFG